jgi:ubiquinone/menaquinone biosynthesis C-methylase UbiE
MIMNTAQPTPGEQSALWNGAAGQTWVQSQELIGQVLQPFEDLLVAALAPETSARVLDVGCGTGSTTLAVARRLGRECLCTGVDISEPMIVAARARAERERLPVTFILADAQTHAFEPASFDTIVSRFGVMFFDDPVRAFANLRRAAAEGARLLFVAWRSAGQFAFGDGDRVRRILEASGWSEIDLQPIDVPCAMPESALTEYVTRFGPVGRVLHEASDQVRAEFIENVRAELAPYVHGTEVRFTSACWRVAARANLRA